MNIITNRAEAIAAVEAAAWDEYGSALSGADIWGQHGQFASQRAASHYTYEMATAEAQKLPATIRVNGREVEVPEGAIAYKHADPTEGARWVYDEQDLRDIKREDPSLVVEAE